MLRRDRIQLVLHLSGSEVKQGIRKIGEAKAENQIPADQSNELTREVMPVTAKDLSNLIRWILQIGLRKLLTERFPMNES